jgi:hypothetical protein
MKEILKGKIKYCILFCFILSLIFLTACDGFTPTSSVINSFTADSTTIDEGDSVTLSWETHRCHYGFLSFASTYTAGSESVALSGSTSVSPTEKLLPIPWKQPTVLV